MRFIDELWKREGNDFAARCTVVVGGGGYFEGVKAVGEFSADKVVLYFSGETLEVEGKNLFIQKYLDGDLQLGGKIALLRRVTAVKEGE